MKTSKKVLLFVITLVMLNNVEHLAVVHHELSRKLFPELLGDWVNKLHSFIVVIIFEIVLITFVREGKKGYSFFFTFCIWVLSMIYYHAPQLIAEGQWEKALAASVYSTIFSISIYMFSEMLAEWYQEENMVKILSTKLIEHQAEIKNLKVRGQDLEASAMQWQAQCEQAQSAVDQLKAQISTLQSQIHKYSEAESKAKKSLTCPHCKDFIAESEAQLRSHKGHCPQNPKSKHQ